MKYVINSFLPQWVPSIVAWNIIGIAVLVVVINIVLSLVQILP